MQHEIEKMYFSTSNIFKDVNISCVQLHRRVSSSSTLAFISAALNARVKRAIAATSHTLLLWCVIFTCRSMYCTFCVCINIVRPQGNDVLMTFEFPPFSFFFSFTFDGKEKIESCGRPWAVEHLDCVHTFSFSSYRQFLLSAFQFLRSVTYSKREKSSHTTTYVSYTCIVYSYWIFFFTGNHFFFFVIIFQRLRHNTKWDMNNASVLFIFFQFVTLSSRLFLFVIQGYHYNRRPKMYVIDYYSSFFFLGFRFHSFFFSFFSTRKLYTKGGGGRRVGQNWFLLDGFGKFGRKYFIYEDQVFDRGGRASEVSAWCSYRRRGPHRLRSFGQ